MQRSLLLRRLPAWMRRTLAGRLLGLLLPTAALLAQETAIRSAPDTKTTAEVRVFASAREAMPTVTERGAHHRVEQWVERIIGEDGATNDVTHSYTVLANGMNYLDGGEWKETVAEFVPVKGGWLAGRGPHQVLVSDDLFVAGAVTVVSPEGQTWKSTPMTLALRDRASGQVWVLGESRATRGELVAANTVLFRDAFAGDAGLRADVRVVTSSGGVECDVIVRSGVPSREALGEAGKAAELVVLTEIFEPGGAKANPVDRGGRSDDVVRLGALTMDQGQAFGTDLPGEPARSVPVFKRVYQDEPSGRVFLEEATPLDSLAPLLEALPEAKLPGAVEARWRNTAGNSVVPARRAGLSPAPAFPRRADGRFEVAANNTDIRTFAAVTPTPGVVLDWSYLNSAANIILRGDTTYYVTSQVSLSGTVRVEGGTVIKFAGGGTAGISLASGTSLDWLAELYRPVFFTAKDDNSIGETISGSNGAPGNNYYANPAFSVPAAVLVNPLNHLRVRHANLGIRVNGTTSQSDYAVVQNAQWVKCNQALTFDNSPNAAKPAKLFNALVTDTAVLFAGCASVHMQVAFLTADSVPSLWANVPGTSLSLTSSILNNVGSTSGTISYPSVWVANQPSSAVFESSAAGAHYLPAASPIRAVNSAGAFASLTDLAPDGDLSISAPPLLSAITGGLVLTTTQTGAPATIGYHYPRLDGLADNVTVSSRLLLTNRAVVGLAGTKSFLLTAGAQVIAGGRPENPVRLVRVSLVQEGTTGLTGSIFKVFEATTAAPPPTIEARFTEFLLPSDPVGRRVLLNDSANAVFSFSLRDCRVTGGTLTFSPPTPSVSQSVVLFNNVFEGAGLYFYRYYDNDLTVSFRQNLVRYGDCWASYYPQTYQNPYWTFKDNLFESVNLLNTAGTYLLGSHNGYGSIDGTGTSATFGGTLTGLKTRTVVGSAPGVTPVVLAEGWQSGPAGRFYYPPKSGVAGNLGQLVDAGSQTVTAAGLFHFATQPAPTREGQENTGQGGANQVNIGYHYPVGNGDQDFDGLLDWIEDPDSDGYDASDLSNWNSADTDGDGLQDGLELIFGSNPKLQDSDGSGGNDKAELDLGSDPLLNTGTVGLLQEWNFGMEGAATFNSDGQLGAATTITPAPATLFDGPAAKFTTGTTGVLKYPIANTFTPLHGTLRFTYVAEWYDGDATDQPGTECRLFECGEWSLSVSANGQALVFRVPKAGGGTKTAFVTSLPRDDGIKLTHRRGWDIELAWTRGGVWLKVNGSLKANEYISGVGIGDGGGVQAAPSSTYLVFGSDATGALKAQGWLDQVQTFNATGFGLATPLWGIIRDRSTQQQHVMSAAAEATGLRLSWVRGWEGDPAKAPENYKVKRRELPTGNWEEVGTVFDHTKLDPVVGSGSGGVRAGKYFEYQAVRSFGPPTTTVAAWKGAPVDNRGRAILLIDETLMTGTDNIAAKVADYKKLLAADGWTVLEHLVPRHQDHLASYLDPTCTTFNSRRTVNNSNVASNKTLIQSDYNASPNEPCVVLLIGHVSIPYSGVAQGDGHVGCDSLPGKTVGAKPADAYYGDMTGTWTTTATTYAKDNACQVCAYDNNDAVFDQDYLPPEGVGLPGLLEVPVGRIDFANLPVFRSPLAGLPQPVPDSANAERKLIKRYFDKVSQFRLAQLVPLDDHRTWLADGNFYSLAPTVQRLNAHLWNSASIYDPARFQTDQFLTANSYLWGVHGDYGNYPTIGNVADAPTRRHQANDIAQTAERPHAMFTLFMGSMFGNWFTYWDDALNECDVLRTCLGVQDSALTVSWVDTFNGSVRWRSDRMHVGWAAYAALQDTFAAHADAKLTYTYLLGDPTIREYYVAPVSGFSATRNGSDVVLTWTNQTAATEGYRVYHAATADTTSWTLLQPPLAAGATTCTHAGVGNSGHAYLIKSVALKATASGSYHNLSQGTATSVPLVP